MTGRSHGSGGTYLETLGILLLLLVYYSEAEVNLVGLFKIRLHLHYRREGLLGVLKRPVSVVQDADAVPELGLLRKGQRGIVNMTWVTNLGVPQINEGILISRVGLLQIIHHEVAVSYRVLDHVANQKDHRQQPTHQHCPRPRRCAGLA